MIEQVKAYLVRAFIQGAFVGLPIGFALGLLGVPGAIIMGVLLAGLVYAFRALSLEVKK